MNKTLAQVILDGAQDRQQIIELCHAANPIIKHDHDEEITKFTFKDKSYIYVSTASVIGIAT